MMFDFLGGWGGQAKSDKIGQNWTMGVGSLAKIGHPIILVFSETKFANSFSYLGIFYSQIVLTKSISSETNLP